MPQQSDRTPLITISVTGSKGLPKHRQIFDAIQAGILEGRLRPGRRLPSTRALAQELDVSRNTVLSAYDQLLAEGYIEGRVGAGTQVSKVLPEDVLAARITKPTTQSRPSNSSPTLSRAGTLLLGSPPRTRVDMAAKAFQPGMPEVARFPWGPWSKLAGKFWRHPPRQLLSYGEPGGYMPLRAAIADYLRAVRGLSCDAEQVLITAGAQQALDLIVRALLDPGDEVWTEEPGYAGIRGVLTAVGAKITPVPVDREGLNVAAGERTAPNARMAIVTPSHQYPLGTVMSLPRRLALLAWTRRQNAWVLEDDYDSEYRYAGRPLSALQGLDQDDRVIYVGTFSKVLFPAIRLGYMVVPSGITDAMLQVRRTLDDQTAIAMQPILTRFIEEGHFAAHVRKMRLLYAERQERLITGLKTKLSGVLEAKPDDAGMHINASLGKNARFTSDKDAVKAAAAVGVTTYALSEFFVGPRKQQGLLLGYAGIEDKDIDDGVTRLARAMSPLGSR